MKMQKKLKRLLFLVHVPFHFLKFDKKKAIGEKSNVNRKRNSGLNKFQIKKSINEPTQRHVQQLYFSLHNRSTTRSPTVGGVACVFFSVFFALFFWFAVLR